MHNFYKAIGSKLLHTVFFSPAGFQQWYSWRYIFVDSSILLNLDLKYKISTINASVEKAAFFI